MQNYDLKSLFPTYSVIEGFKAVVGNTTTEFTDNYPEFEKYVNTQIDMCNNIMALKAKIKLGNDNDILDEKGNMKPTGRLVDVARQDVQYILVQQNTLYMIGTMTIATLLITAILISNK